MISVSRNYELHVRLFFTVWLGSRAVLLLFQIIKFDFKGLVQPKMKIVINDSPSFLGELTF